MSIMYDCYSDLIDCNNRDKVYIYNKNIFEKNKIAINKIGTIETITQSIKEDWLNTGYLNYIVKIQLYNGEKITIKDENQEPFFRKYEFITLRDLKEKCKEKNITEYESFFL